MPNSVYSLTNIIKNNNDNTYNRSGICQIEYTHNDKFYIGQTGRPFKIQFQRYTNSQTQ